MGGVQQKKKKRKQVDAIHYTLEVTACIVPILLILIKKERIFL